MAASGGFLAASLLWPLAVRFNFLGTANLLSQLLPGGTITTRVEEKTVLVPLANYLTTAIDKVKANVVALQSFSQGQLLRSGSGLILTRDGLIVSTNSVLPAEAQIFQTLQDGKIYRGKVVWRDYRNNLAILSVPANDLTVSRLNFDQPALAEHLLLFARLVELAKDRPLLAEGLVTDQAPDQSSFGLSVAYDRRFYGAAIGNAEGEILGILDFANGQAKVISAATINNALAAYLQKLTK